MLRGILDKWIQYSNIVMFEVNPKSVHWTIEVAVLIRLFKYFA